MTPHPYVDAVLAAIFLAGAGMALILLWLLVGTWRRNSGRRDMERTLRRMHEVHWRDTLGDDR